MGVDPLFQEKKKNALIRERSSMKYL